MTFGTSTQNCLTVAKVLGLAAIVVVGFGWGTAEEPSPAAAPVRGGRLVRDRDDLRAVDLFRLA